jgi:UPF0755 protein
MKRISLGKTGIKFVIIGLCLLMAHLIFLNFFLPLTSVGEWKEVWIPHGSSYTHGLNTLKREGIVKNEFIFHVIGKLTGIDTDMKAGYYNLNTSMSPWNVLGYLRKGLIVQHRITIPEGSDLNSIKPKFIDAGLISDESWKIVYDREFLELLDVKAPSLEGYLYPDTYRFAKGTKPRDIFRIMVQRLRQHFDQELLKRAEEIGMSEREVITLASIIEKEVIYNTERPLVSAVYNNRLKRNMRLQADPTVNYGVLKKDNSITRSDLKRATPYNTYVIRGLPPGPIASPGIRSIRAALNPADSDYLFFVSKNNGTHHFSRTGIEHMEAVMIYQRGGGS